MLENPSEKIVLNWQAHESFCRHCFEQELLAVYIIKPDGRITTCNQSFANTLGYEKVGDVIGNNLKSYFKNSASYDEFLHTIEKEKWAAKYETHIQRQDGDVKEISQNVIGVFDEKGNLNEIRGFLVKNGTPMILDERIIRARKIEVLGELATGMAHGFNNLLMSFVYSIKNTQGNNRFFYLRWKIDKALYNLHDIFTALFSSLSTLFLTCLYLPFILLPLAQ